MLVKDLIAQLQEINPEGDARVNIPGGALKWLDLLPGYYDGHVQYLDEEKRLVFTKEGTKVNFMVEDIEDIVFDWEEEGDEALESRIIFHPSIGQHNIDKLKERMEKCKKEVRSSREATKREWLERVLGKYREGYIGVADAIKEDHEWHWTIWLHREKLNELFDQSEKTLILDEDTIRATRLLTDSRGIVMSQGEIGALFSSALFSLRTFNGVKIYFLFNENETNFYTNFQQEKQAL